ncbi:MAG: FAD-dependent monooxygenase [Nanoarchaeota archaeon]
MKRFDVVIVGAGPAGLKAAEILAKHKKVIVLEKNKVIGPKVCAAGITQKDLEYIPDELIERKFDSFFIVSKGRVEIKQKLYTIERKKLGEYQADLAKKAGAIIKTECEVSQIKDDYVITNKGRYYFDYLIGADGSNSIVRKHIGLGSKIMGLGIQYNIKIEKEEVEIYFDPKKFGLFYAWIFPHKNFTYVGTGSLIPQKGLKSVLDNFIKEQKLNLDNAKFEAALINPDYKGYKFNNIFLAGDAAGLANIFSGEGIYQAIVSGEEIAKKIINPKYDCYKLRKIIRKNIKLIQLFKFLKRRPFIFEKISMNEILMRMCIKYQMKY